MKLEIGNFNLKDVTFGDVTSYKDGILTINKEEAIAALDPNHQLQNIELHIVHPGDSARLLPVKEIVEARARPDGRAVFPGLTGPMASSGDGVVYAIKGMAVTAVGQYACGGDGILDMSGPAAELTTPYSQLIHVCFTANNVDPSEENSETTKKNLWFRLGAELLGEYLGKTVLDQTPDSWEVFDHDTEVDPSLPRVALVQQCSCAWMGEGYNTRIYGTDMVLMYPNIMDPNEFLDGAMTADTLFFPSVRMQTYCYQNHPLVKELYAEHGKTLNFVCIILDVNPPVADRKIRASNQVANIARLLKLDGALVEGNGNGHSEIDFFTTIHKLEDIGVKCVGHMMESPGHGGGMQSKVVLDPTADALVSIGCDHVVMNLPKMDTIIGDLASIGRDNYTGAWAYDAEYGPSLHDDGSLCIDSTVLIAHNGNAGWSHKTVKSY